MVWHRKAIDTSENSIWTIQMDDRFTVEILTTESGFDVCVMDEAGEVREARHFGDLDEAENHAWSMAVKYDCVYRKANPPDATL